MKAYNIYCSSFILAILSRTDEFQQVQMQIAVIGVEQAQCMYTKKNHKGSSSISLHYLNVLRIHSKVQCIPSHVIHTVVVELLVIPLQYLSKEKGIPEASRMEIESLFCTQLKPNGNTRLEKIWNS